MLPSNAVITDGKVLEIQNVSKSNQGVYRCFGTILVKRFHIAEIIPIEAYGILNVSG